MIGLNLFGDKIADPEDMTAYWVMVALVSTFGIVDGALSCYFGFSRYYCVERTKPEVGSPEMEMKHIGSSDSSSSPPPKPPTRKKPSQVSFFCLFSLVEAFKCGHLSKVPINSQLYIYTYK